jgi:ribonucleoside-diphosphate reductase alpha chain
MNCPYCPPEDECATRVIESRATDDGRVIRRRRECESEARHRFTTYERFADDEQDELRPANHRRLPRERQAITHKFSVGGHEGYVTAGMYEDGTVGEIFLSDVGKDGSTIKGMMNAFASSISVALQHGVPLRTLVDQFAFSRFEPEGYTGNPEIPFAKSIPDYIMRWLAARFLDADDHERLDILTPEIRARKAAQEAMMRGETEPAQKRRRRK